MTTTSEIHADATDAHLQTGEQRSSGKKLSETPHVHASSRIVQSVLGPYTDVGANCSIVESSFGDYSYAAGDVSIIYSEVGKYCSVASHVRLNPGNHPMQRVTQHHMTYRRAQYGFGETDDAEFFDWRRAHKVVVGHDVWIGHGAILLPGVSVGSGAVIGAGSVVTHDVEPYTIAVGVPARPLRMRFTEAQAKKLLAIAWWDWPREVLAERFEELNNLDAFLEKYG